MRWKSRNSIILDIISFRGLPQLAVLAKILCLLMVVMSGAVPSTVPSVSLYSTCSRGYVTVYGRTVKSTLRNEHSAPYQKMITQSQDFSRKLYIFAEKSKRYICFNRRWKIVTLPEKKRNEYCQFNETYNGRYLRYHSVIDPTRYIGFSKTGKPITWPKGRQECYNFLKMNPSAGVERHNSLIASAKGGGMKHPEHRNGLRALANSLVSSSSSSSSSSSTSNSNYSKNSMLSPYSSTSSAASSSSSSSSGGSGSSRNGINANSGKGAITQRQQLRRRHRHRHGKSWDEAGSKRRRHHQHHHELQASDNREKY